MNEIELQSRIQAINTLINGLKKNSFVVSNKPFGDSPVNIYYLLSFIGADPKRVIKELYVEMDKLQLLLERKKNGKHCNGCVLSHR